MAANNNTAEVPNGPEPSASSTEQAPESAGYPVEYIMSVNLQEDEGTNIPLTDRRLRYHASGGRRVFTPYRGPDPFDMSKEDYWLFSVHINEGDMQFLIGGETPAYVTSGANWHDISNDRAAETTIAKAPSGQTTYGKLCFENERLVAVRAPKATNPAVTVWGSGNYTALNWVGLFVKTTNHQTNEFIALKTSRSILPKYATRTLEKMKGTDVTKRSITMFPKQLFGTNGLDGTTFDKFVTDDPANTLGDKHWAESKIDQRGLRNKYATHMWNTSGTTLIEGTNYTNDIRFPNPIPLGYLYDYAKGRNLKLENQNGIELLVKIFGTLVKAALEFARGDIADAIKSFVDFTEDELKKANPNAKGIITAVVEIGRAVIDTAGKKVNTDGVDELVKKHSLAATDFGSC